MTTIKDMFFEFRFLKLKGDNINLSPQSEIISNTNGYASVYAKNMLTDLACGNKKMIITLSLGYPDSIKKEIGSNFVENDESYALNINSDKIDLYSPTERGLIYAVSTLRQLIEKNRLSEMLLFDYPDQAVRGYRVYTPGINTIEKFKNMVDMLVYYKYNSLIIEVGGAMEYHKHPEINKKWVEFCTEVNKSPYEADRIQQEIYSWAKNSIHAENGDGAYISQEQMRDVVAYCKERELNVIPEVPSLSHSDYIVMAYPELNERKEDAYPDTYCPSNPKSYEVLFDIIDEVVDVFDPEYINIGHDECYTLAKCEKCRHKSPVDLYVEDITRINDYLKSKGIKSIMWGEKLYGNVYVTDEDGSRSPAGGTGNPAHDIPRLAECAGRIPKDVTLLQWYWSLCTGEEEREVHDMGYNMIYGNYRPIALKDYRERIKVVTGGFVSNWGSVEEEYMQRNGQNYALLTSAWIFWSGRYNENIAPELIGKVKSELYARYCKTLGDDVIELVHTTDYYCKYKSFYCGYYIVQDDWTIGWHEVTYTDGTKARLPVIYGYNIRSSTKNGIAVSDLECAEACVSSDIEVIGATYSFYEDNKIMYKTSYKNPHPEKQIENITYISKDGIAVEAKYNL